MLKHTVKKVISIFEWLLTIVLVSVVLLLIFTAFDPVKSFRVLRVMSGSMEPAIKVGSVVFVQKVNTETLKKGDIITFASTDDPTISITHRLAAIEEKGGKTVFKTKGDANNTGDVAEISSSQIRGRVIFSLPFLGYLSVWIKQPMGFGLLVILPAILIIISEILNIKKSIAKEVEKKYEEAEKQRQSRSINSLIILCLLGIGLFQIKTTNGYFSDVAVISGNTFSAGYWETDAGKVVINEVYYNVSSDCGNEGTDSNPDEWIELYNNSGTDVDLKNWTLTDNSGNPVIIHSGSKIIPADGFAIISKDAKTWTPAVGCWNPPSEAIKINTGVKIGNGLGNDGDRLILKDEDGNVKDAISWGNDSYAFGDGQGINPLTGNGKSIARITKGVDNDLPSDWQVLPDPNPGTNPHFAVSAKDPQLSLTISSDKKTASFTVSNIKDFVKLFYQLTYDTDSKPQGVIGSIDLDKQDSFSQNNITLGTCSSGGKCVYHEGIKNLNLTVTLESKKGEITTLKQNIP